MVGGFASEALLEEEEEEEAEGTIAFRGTAHGSARLVITNPFLSFRMIGEDGMESRISAVGTPFPRGEICGASNQGLGGVVGVASR